MTLNFNPSHYSTRSDKPDDVLDFDSVRKHGDSSSVPVQARGAFAALVAPITLATGDAVIYLASALVVARIDAGNTLTERLLVLLALAAIFSYASAGLYPGYRLHNYERLRRRVYTTLKLAVFAGFGSYLLLGSLFHVSLVLVVLGAGLILQPLAEIAIAALLNRYGFWGENAVIIGSPADVDMIGAVFRHDWRFGIRPESSGKEPARARIALLAGSEMPARTEIERLQIEFDEVFLLADLPHRRLCGLRPADLGGELGIRLAHRGSCVQNARFSRILDVAIAVPALIVAMPIIVIAAAAIKLADPGPALYTQVREGVNRRSFRLLKLRTMYQDSEERLADLLRDDPAARREWGIHFKLRDDPRILPIIGQLLRVTSFDELPQLFNVITGDMRIVGPRPFPDYHLQAMDVGFRDRRCSVTPGLTGLWQVSGRSSNNVEQQQAIDDFYISNRSLWLDFDIILRTALTVLRGRGAY